jgi:hypothetical protein
LCARTAHNARRRQTTSHEMRESRDECHGNTESILYDFAAGDGAAPRDLAEELMNLKQLMMLILLFFAVLGYAQQPPTPPATLKGTLLQQLRETHNHKEWFVSAKEAVAGLTPEQASWTGGKGNHSVGQLTYHMAFWDAETLADFNGESHEKFNGKNDDTFDKYDPKQWEATVKKLEEEMTGREKAVEAADDAKIQKWAPTISKIAGHRAYHIGEIVMVRKEQGSWNPEQGVK